MWKHSSKSPTANNHDYGTRNRKQRNTRDETTHFGHQGDDKELKEISETHRPLFGGEIYLTGREVCERLFISPRTLQDYRDNGIIPYTQIAGKILYRLSDINRLLQENYVKRNTL